MIDSAILLRIPLFQRLNAGALRELAARSALRTFQADEVLWHAGSEPRGFFVILEGVVRVVRTVHGRQHVVHVEGPGGTLGDVALFEGTAYPATAVANCRTACLAVSRDGLLAAIRQDPELALSLLGRLAARVRHVIGRLDGLAARSVSARLAGYLLERRARGHGRVHAGRIALHGRGGAGHRARGAGPQPARPARPRADHHRRERRDGDRGRGGAAGGGGGLNGGLRGTGYR
jgi:CRP-like cAMP-binding protein